MPGIFRYANPGEFMRLSRALLPFTAAAAVLLLGAGLYLGFTAPPDYQQGMTVTIMFIHVPAAINAEGIYALIAVSSLFSLVWRHPLADVAARAAAPLGALFTALGLVTGSLWGRPMWGAWWVWDGRLTSTFVLFLVYVAYLALRASMDDETKAARACAILALVGSVNLPIIYWSVDWWNSLHQGSTIFAKGGPAMPPVYLIPFGLMTFAYMSAFGSLWLVRIRGEVWRRRAEALALRAARA
jgi:heme exporter protein C